MRLLGVRVALRSTLTGIRRFTGVLLSKEAGVVGYLKGGLVKGLRVESGVDGVDGGGDGVRILGLRIGEVVGVNEAAGGRR